MPATALKSLRDQIAIEDGEDAAEVLMRRYGFRCGEGVIENMGLTCENTENLPSMVDGLFKEVGVGRVEFDVGGDEFTAKIKESIDPRHKGRDYCSFTGGYIAGMVSELLGKKYKEAEEKCISEGDECCQFSLAPEKEALSPTMEEMSTAELRFVLETGLGYLVKGEEPTKAYEIFTELVTHGMEGLCITRDFPERVRKKYGLEKTPMIWLSTTEKPYTINPNKLSELFYRIETFLNESKQGIILLSGLEYLITQNNYLSVLKFVQLLDEQVAINDGILIVPLTPKALKEQDLSLIESELNVFRE